MTTPPVSKSCAGACMQNVLCASRLSPSNFIIPLGVRTRPELRACFDRRLRAFDVDVELVESVGTSSFVSTTAIGRASCFPSARPPPTSACLGRRESALSASRPRRHVKLRVARETLDTRSQPE